MEHKATAQPTAADKRHTTISGRFILVFSLVGIALAASIVVWTMNSKHLSSSSQGIVAADSSAPATPQSLDPRAQHNAQQHLAHADGAHADVLGDPDNPAAHGSRGAHSLPAGSAEKSRSSLSPQDPYLPPHAWTKQRSQTSRVGKPTALVLAEAGKEPKRQSLQGQGQGHGQSQGQGQGLAAAPNVPEVAAPAFDVPAPNVPGAPHVPAPHIPGVPAPAPHPVPIITQPPAPVPVPPGVTEQPPIATHDPVTDTPVIITSAPATSTAEPQPAPTPAPTTPAEPVSTAQNGAAQNNPAQGNSGRSNPGLNPNAGQGTRHSAEHAAGHNNAAAIPRSAAAEPTQRP